MVMEQMRKMTEVVHRYTLKAAMLLFAVFSFAWLSSFAGVSYEWNGQTNFSVDKCPGQSRNICGVATSRLSGENFWQSVCRHGLHMEGGWQATLKWSVSVAKDMKSYEVRVAPIQSTYQIGGYGYPLITLTPDSSTLSSLTKATFYFSTMYSNTITVQCTESVQIPGLSKYYNYVLSDGYRTYRFSAEQSDGYAGLYFIVTTNGGRDQQISYSVDTDVDWMPGYGDGGGGTTTAPANDNFASATTISGASGSKTGSNVGATSQSGEPLLSVYSTAKTTVWWKWTAPSSGDVQIDTTGSSFDTQMGIYTGSSLSSLDLVAKDDDNGGNYASRAIFACNANTTYYICVGGYQGKTGTVKLNWNLEESSTSYKVTYKPGIYGSGSQTTATKTAGKSLTLKGATFTRTGYAQTGWSKNASGSTKDYGLSALYATDAAVTLYPYWMANTYSISYALNGGSHGSIHPTSATYDTAFYISAPSRPGYTFAGWTVTSGLNTSTAKWGTSSNPSTSISSSSTKCVNGMAGDVYFKNLTADEGVEVTLVAVWKEKKPTPVMTGDWYVDATSGNDSFDGKSWSSAFASIQKAIDVARSGQTIVVNDGEYDPIVSKGTDLEIKSVNGAKDTVIDASREWSSGVARRCVAVEGNVRVSLSGFTLTNGRTVDSGYGAGANGGILNDCVICGCHASGFSMGGGVCSNVLNRCVLYDNSAACGGGGCDCQAFDCIISNNTSGVYNREPKFTTASVALKGLDITALLLNSAACGGGLIGGSAVGCVFVGNKCVKGQYGGGGMAGGVATNCLFVGNVAKEQAGGMCRGQICGCTFVDNKSGENTLAPDDVVSGVLYNCIVKNGTGSVKESACTNVCVSDVSIHGVGMLYADPRFVDASHGDYRLSPDSPCINAGDNSFVAIATDLIGNTRIADGVVDLGAYERQHGKDRIVSVRFDANGGNVEVEGIDVDVGCAIGDMPVPNRAGHRFLGWFTKNLGGVEVESTTIVSADVVCHAHWQIVASYAVLYEPGACGLGSQAKAEKTEGVPLILMGEVFSRAGYVQNGWSKVDGGAKDFGLGASYTADVAVSLYPYWMANSYTVVFNANGGSGTMANEPMTYDAEKALTACAFTKKGYRFAGWATSADGAVKYADGATVKNLATSGTVTLYAKWTANEYTVKFNANGGKGVMADQAFLYDAAQNLASNKFTRTGCEFLGWATSPVGEVVCADGEAVSNLTATADGVVNLYAVWDGTATTWMEDGSFSAAVANTYDGYVIDENYNLLGVVQVKTTKQSSKGVVTATATVTDANGKKWSYSNGEVELVGSGTSGEDAASPLVGLVTGLKCTTKGCPVEVFGVALGKNGMEGEWGEYALFGARNGLGTKGDEMMAELEDYKGKWSVTLSGASLTSGEDAASPLVVRLQLNVQAKGDVKIAGDWENGAKVSASAQMIMGDGFAYVPVMIKATKTSAAVNALLRIDPEGGVALLSATDPARPESAPYQLVDGGRSVDELGEPAYLPSEVSKGGEAFSARVAVDELAYPAKFTAKKLPAGLKINAATGVISGTPTKPGHYVAEVTVTSGLNSKVKETLTVEFDIANYTDDLISVEDSYGPYYVGVSAEEQIAAAAGCSVSGLPSGLKWTAKDVFDSKTKELKTAANTVYGIPTKACTNTVYFKKSVKELVGGKPKTVTHQASATFIVEGMRPWAIGTFNGGNTNGMVTVTVSKTGKISGKWMSEGLAWTLSAASFDAFDAEREAYYATVIGKSGKLVMTNEIEVTAAGLVGYSHASTRDASGTVLFKAWRNGWKEGMLKTIATTLKDKTWTDEDAGGILQWKVGSSGAVTVKLTTIGLDDKPYSASCSTVLIPTEEAGRYRVYLYFPPKAGKFAGFADVVEIDLGEGQ